MITGISGKKQSGKDLIGKIIQFLLANEDGKPCFKNKSFEEFIRIPIKDEIKIIYVGTWRIKKFAKKVKEILSILTGISVEDMEKEEVKNSYLREEWDRYGLVREGCRKPIFFPLTKEYIIEQMKLFKNPTLYEEKITVRQAMQFIGADLFRDKFHPQTWCNALFSDYKEKTHTISKQYEDFENGILKKESESRFPNWIITDVRFKNEAQTILDRDGILIRVNRSRHNWKLQGARGDLKTLTVFPDESSFETKGIVEHHSETALDNYDKFHYVIENDSTIEDLIEKVRVILIKENLIK